MKFFSSPKNNLSLPCNIVVDCDSITRFWPTHAHLDDPETAPIAIQLFGNDRIYHKFTPYQTLRHRIVQRFNRNTYLLLQTLSGSHNPIYPLRQSYAAVLIFSCRVAQRNKHPTAPPLHSTIGALVPLNSEKTGRVL